LNYILVHFFYTCGPRNRDEDIDNEHHIISLPKPLFMEHLALFTFAMSRDHIAKLCRLLGGEQGSRRGVLGIR
jgi:hypothetical protein